VGDSDDLLLVSRKGYSVRFHSNNESLRPMGRSTSGVIGMRFKGEDNVLAMEVVREGAFLLTATDGGFAKRTPVDEWNSKGRGTQGVRAMKLVEERGALVGALIVDESDQVFAVASNVAALDTFNSSKAFSSLTELMDTRTSNGLAVVNFTAAFNLFPMAVFPLRTESLTMVTD
jgi:DNA gyrase subunit A